MQLSFFEAMAADLADPRKLARREDPDTSHAAAQRVSEFNTKHHALILSTLKEHGARKGLTVHEIATYTRLDAHAVGKRMKELDDAGLVKVLLDAALDPVTRPSPSGRQARVWVLA